MMGYKIAMVKIGGQPQLPGVVIDGDKELLRYLDITGYSFKKEPLKRTFPKSKIMEQINNKEVKIQVWKGCRKIKD